MITNGRDKANFTRKVKEILLKETGLSVKELAEKLRVSYRQVGHSEQFPNSYSRRKGSFRTCSGYSFKLIVLDSPTAESFRTVAEFCLSRTIEPDSQCRQS